MRIIPDDNLAYAVLLKFNTGISGSGFLLKTPEKIYFITAKHVLLNNEGMAHGDTIELICQTKDLKDSSVNRYNIDVSKIVILYHTSADVAAIEIGQLIPVEAENVIRHKIKHNYGIKEIESGKTPMVSAFVGETTKTMDEVGVGNDVVLYGYPTSLGIKESPQFDYDKPLLRKGAIANIYPEKGTIILDCPVYYGNSGGPAVEIELEVDEHGIKFGHKIIGVVSQFIPFVEQWTNTKNNLTNTEFSNSGYSVVVSMDKVFEIIGYK